MILATVTEGYVAYVALGQDRAHAKALLLAGATDRDRMEVAIEDGDVLFQTIDPGSVLRDGVIVHRGVHHV